MYAENYESNIVKEEYDAKKINQEIMQKYPNLDFAYSLYDIKGKYIAVIFTSTNTSVENVDQIDTAPLAFIGTQLDDCWKNAQA